MPKVAIKSFQALPSFTFTTISEQTADFSTTSSTIEHMPQIYQETRMEQRDYITGDLKAVYNAMVQTNYYDKVFEALGVENKTDFYQKFSSAFSSVDSTAKFHFWDCLLDHMVYAYNPKFHCTNIVHKFVESAGDLVDGKNPEDLEIFFKALERHVYDLAVHRKTVSVFEKTMESKYVVDGPIDRFIDIVEAGLQENAQKFLRSFLQTERGNVALKASFLHGSDEAKARIINIVKEHLISFLKETKSESLFRAFFEAELTGSLAESRDAIVEGMTKDVAEYAFSINGRNVVNALVDFLDQKHVDAFVNGLDTANIVTLTNRYYGTEILKNIASSKRVGQEALQNFLSKFENDKVLQKMLDLELRTGVLGVLIDVVERLKDSDQQEVYDKIVDAINKDDDKIYGLMRNQAGAVLLVRILKNHPSANDSFQTQTNDDAHAELMEKIMKFGDRTDVAKSDVEALDFFYTTVVQMFPDKKEEVLALKVAPELPRLSSENFESDENGETDEQWQFFMSKAHQLPHLISNQKASILLEQLLDKIDDSQAQTLGNKIIELDLVKDLLSNRNGAFLLLRYLKRASSQQRTSILNSSIKAFDKVFAENRKSELEKGKGSIAGSLWFYEELVKEEPRFITWNVDKSAKQDLVAKVVEHYHDLIRMREGAFVAQWALHVSNIKQLDKVSILSKILEENKVANLLQGRYPYGAYVIDSCVKPTDDIKSQEEREKAYLTNLLYLGKELHAITKQVEQNHYGEEDSKVFQRVKMILNDLGYFNPREISDEIVSFFEEDLKNNKEKAREAVAVIAENCTDEKHDFLKDYNL
eukprot:snap_masked-scaffold_52-processed-gene-1.41-mRNA-1 protein AED:1.00 eAED:1.00 QI:0/-1/0/0/-1/1/1/0/815